MENTYLQRFCELLDDNLPLDNSSAISFYHKIKKECLPKLKSEISKNLVPLPDGSKKDYLDYVINEIESQDYFKDVKVQTLEEHFERNNVDLEEVTPILRFEFNKVEPKIYRLLETNYKSFEPFSPEKDEAFLFQNDFVNFVCSFCAAEIIDLCTKKYPQPIPEPKLPKPHLPFKKEYLEVFCEIISDEREVNTTSLMMLFDTSLTHYGPYLETEIRENLLQLDRDKQDIYIDYAIDVIEKTPFVKQDKDYISKWLKEYNSSAENFPENISEELNSKLNTYWKARYLEEEEQYHLQDMQIDFFVHIAREQARTMIAFLKAQKKPSPDIPQGSPKPHQLTANQIIILLDKLGLFVLIEDLPKTKQAEFLSKITGLNQQNLRANLSAYFKLEGTKASKRISSDTKEMEDLISSYSIDLKRFN